MAASFRMILRSGPNPGKVFPVEKSEIFIGRDLSNDVVINDPEISRRHTRLFTSGGGRYMVEDLGSTNGTSVNGQRVVGPYALNHNDVLTLGERVTLVYEASLAGDVTVAAGGGQADQTAQNPQAAYPQAYPPAYPPQTYEAPVPQPAMPAYQSPGISYPPVQPPYQQVPPPPMAYDPGQMQFSGQVPQGQPEGLAEPRQKMPIWPFIVIGILLLIILVLVIDDFKLWYLLGLG